MSVILNNLSNLSEWIEENADQRVTGFFLMGSIWPTLILMSVYLLFVLKLGPNYMKNRRAFNIDRIVMVYDVIQVFFSLYLVIEAFRLVWLQDDYRFDCIEIDFSDTPKAKDKLVVVWLYYFSKVLDLLDTVFFVLRKKDNQVTFLHIYHHSMVLFFSMIVAKFFPGGQVAFFGTVNACVHVVMYSYYFLTVLKPEYKKAWWKKHLTQLQLIQFVITGVHACLAMMATDCKFPKALIAIGLPQDMFMFMLFWDFYKKNYRKPSNKQS